MANTAQQRDEEETAALTAAVEQGRASAKAGATMPYQKVRNWLLSWGTKDELPKPKCP